MKNWLREKAIDFLFRLLGNYSKPTDGLSLLFTGKNAMHDVRKKNWQRGLASIWENKAFIDFLFYQAEADKENAWRGKVKKEITQGARVRTLFIVYQAQKAHMSIRQGKGGTPDAKDTMVKRIQAFDKTYQKTVDIE